MISPMGDRQLAGLLSALAEAPDFAAAASFLLERVVDLTRSKRGCMMRIDSVQDSLVAIASHDMEGPRNGPSLTELSNPLVLSTLSLSALMDVPGIGIHGLGSG